MTNMETKDVMNIEHYSNRTIESKIEVPRMVHTWMRHMIYISGVHVLFVHWWGEWGKKTEKNSCFSYLHGKTIHSTHHNSGNYDEIKPIDGRTINQIYEVSNTPTVYVKDLCAASVHCIVVWLVLKLAMTTFTLFVALVLFVWWSWQILDIKTEFKTVPSYNAIGGSVALEGLFLPAANMGTDGHWCLAETIFIDRRTRQITRNVVNDLTTVYYLFRQETGVHVLCDAAAVIAMRVEQDGYCVRKYEFQQARASDKY